MRRWRRLAIGASYVLGFALAMGPWLRRFDEAAPLMAAPTLMRRDAAFPGAHPLADTRLILWILSWVAHALRVDPMHLYDANIFHPAPAQLAGSEHLLSLQVVFTPVFWLFDDPVLSSNVVLFLSYPLSALAMYQLLRVTGASALVAWLGGWVFALGPLRVPANVQSLQYVPAFLPMALSATTLVYRRPNRTSLLSLCAVLLLGLFSSYYMAVMLVAAVGTWTLLLLAQRPHASWRFPFAVTGAVSIAAIALAVFSLPYFARPASPALGILADAMARATPGLLRRGLPVWFGGASLFVAALGMILALVRSSPERRLAVAGVTIIGTSVLGIVAIVALGQSHLAPSVPFRIPWRWVVLAGVGSTLATAAALEWTQRRLGALAALTLGAALVLPRLASMLDGGFDRLKPTREVAEVYRLVRETTSRVGPGPLLELPLVDRDGQRGLADPMLRSTTHWLPLANGFTGYGPPHEWLLNERISQLPAAPALDDLVSMTGLGWILLHPAETWAHVADRDALLDAAGVEVAWHHAGFTFVRITTEPSHAWSAAIARGWRPGETVLGTPLVRLPPEGAVATLSSVTPLSRSVAADAEIPLSLTVRNAGTVAWPVSLPFGDRGPLRVHLLARIVDQTGAREVARTSLELPRDVDPGESLVVRGEIGAPAEVGLFTITVTVEQVEGAAFDGAGNESVRHDFNTFDPDPRS